MKRKSIEILVLGIGMLYEKNTKQQYYYYGVKFINRKTFIMLCSVEMSDVCYYAIEDMHESNVINKLCQTDQLIIEYFIKEHLKCKK